VVGTAKKLAALMQRTLCGLRLFAVMMDGVRLAEHAVLAPVGVDLGGRKRVLGLRGERPRTRRRARHCSPICLELTRP
jgi:hypothetical protein